MKISTEDFTDATLPIDDTYGDDVRGGDGRWAMGDGQCHSPCPLDMENDKVAVIVLGISNEDFIYGTVVIDGIISKLRC